MALELKHLCLRLTPHRQKSAEAPIGIDYAMQGIAGDRVFAGGQADGARCRGLLLALARSLYETVVPAGT
jgi:hypothetical protein